MHACWCKSTDGAFLDFAARALLVVLAVGCASGADLADQIDHADEHTHHALDAEPAFTDRVSSVAAGLWHVAADQARRAGRRLLGWYVHTPPADRVTWGG